MRPVVHCISNFNTVANEQLSYWWFSKFALIIGIFRQSLSIIGVWGLLLRMHRNCYLCDSGTLQVVINMYVRFMLMEESVETAVFPAAWGDVRVRPLKLLCLAVNRRMMRRLGDYPSSCRSSTALLATFQSLRRASSSFSSTICLKLGPVRLVDDASHHISVFLPTAGR